MEKRKKSLDEARDAWCSLHEFRARRKRCKDFTFGRQWGDIHRLSDGRIISEETQWLDAGRIPVCNNLIRQLVKSIVGRWRFNRGKSDSQTPLREDDSRTFEEFLISGCALQRVERGMVENVSPARIFFRRFNNSDASDCTMIGMLHDMDPTEVMRRFRPTSRKGFVDLSLSLGTASVGEGFTSAVTRPPCVSHDPDFGSPDANGTFRIIEIWRKQWYPILRIHDPEKGSCFEIGWSEASFRRIRRVNERRRERKGKEVMVMHDVKVGWECEWLTSDGTLLGTSSAPVHPFILSLYPMVDGEVHSLVDDVIDQQKSVNNLIMLLDSVLRASAKGVILFPTDQLPRGMTWKDVKRVWSEPGGILPFRRTSKNIMPYQLNTGGTIAGAGELLDTQMRMFNEITGTNASSRGSASTAKGAEMMTRELEQASVSIYDLLSTFDGFLSRRDLRMDS